MTWATNHLKASLLRAFDESGITSVFLDPSQGGFIEGPKNLALALVAFELAWVDAGAATGSLANCLALAPIHAEAGIARINVATYQSVSGAGRKGLRERASREKESRADSEAESAAKAKPGAMEKTAGKGKPESKAKPEAAAPPQ